SVNSGADDPPGVQNFTALPPRIPPARSSSSRGVVPSGASYGPGRVTWPESENRPNPAERSVPIDVNQSAPRATIDGTLAIDSTLLTTVGRAYRPATAGHGGLSRGCPRRPSSEAGSAGYSPQMYAPAPAWTVTSRSKPDPSTSVPRYPASYASSTARSRRRYTCSTSPRT